MKRTLLLLAVFITAAAYSENSSSDRFERIVDEHHAGLYNHAQIFEVWHDKVSGQEFTCVVSHDTNSTGGLDGKAWPLTCFPTGRNWK